MRTDSKLDADARQSEAWRPVSGTEYTVEDLLTTTVPPGFSFSGSERNHLFLSRQGQQFDDISGISGLDSPADSRSFALLDYDRDGWLDVAVVNVSKPTVNLYHNEVGRHQTETGATAPVIAVRLVGGNQTARPSTQFSTRDAYGALVEVDLGERRLLREQRCGEGFAAQNTATIVIGIGAHSTAQRVAIRWPSGRQQEIPDVAAGTLLTVYENPTDAPGEEFFVAEPYVVDAARTLATDNSSEGDVPVKLSIDAVEDAALTAPLRMYTTMATWCSSCKSFLPQLARLRGTLDEASLAMFGVPVDPDDEAAELDDYAAQYEPAYRLLTSLDESDRQAVEQLVIDKFGEAAPLPATILTDAHGRVLETFAGVPTLSEARQALHEVQ